MNLEVAPANVHDLAMAPGLAEGAQGSWAFSVNQEQGNPPLQFDKLLAW